MGLRERVGRMASSEEDSATPVGAAETSELRRFIAGLPADEQAVCELLMQGLSVREIARQIRRRWLTIEHKVDRIRQRLLLAGFDSRLDA
jgi:DNA-binding NarL/FixJ family response regulator